MIGGGLGGWAPGEWTDDTQQAVCVAEEAATGRIDPDAVGERLLAWYRSGPADVGAQTAAVLGRAQTGAALPSLASTYLASHPRGGAGNGSLMRTGPVALAHLGDDAAIASVARAVGDVAALAGVDPGNTEVVVSLCRVGRDDVPGDVERVAIWLLDDASPAENPNLDLVLADLGEQIAAWRDEGRRVFVHCVRAESQTPTVAAAYLAHRLGIPGDAALRRVLDALPSASPNPAFVAALRRIWPS